MERDTTGRETREIATFDESEAIASHPLADGAVSIIPTDRRSISIMRRPGKRDVTWPVPDWMSAIGVVARSLDARSLAVGGGTTSHDSVVVATVDIETGGFTRLTTRTAEEFPAITWLTDGSIMFVLREPEGAYGLYRVSPGRPAERLGALPQAMLRSSACRTMAGTWRCSVTTTRTMST